MLYIEDLKSEHEVHKEFGFTFDFSTPLDDRVTVLYKDRPMISLSIQDTTSEVLTDICFALKRAYLEGEIYGRFAECMSI